MPHEEKAGKREVKPKRLLPVYNMLTWEPVLEDVIRGTSATATVPKRQDNSNRVGHGERPV